MPKICIICRKTKDKFNAEHIVLATIGGSLEINSICKSCNTNLGKKFNEPFLKNPVISLHRKNLNLSRYDERTGNRNIANPLKKATLHGEGASDYYLKFENNQASARLKPKVKFTGEGDNWLGSIVASKEDVNEIVKNELEKRGIDKSKVKFDYKENNEPQKIFQAVVMFNDKHRFYECIKMAYEFAVTIIPEYYNDKWAIIISEFLDSYKNKELVESRIESVNTMLTHFQGQFETLRKYPDFFHIISLKQYKNIGLVCFVKIFNFIIPFHLSSNEYISDYNKEIVAFFNAIDKTHFFMMPLRWETIKISVGFDGIEYDESILIKKELSEDRSLYSNNDKIPVYDKNGTLISNDLTGMIPYKFDANKKINFEEGIISYDITMPEGEYFLQYKPLNKFLPLLGCNVLYKIKYNG